MKTFAFTWIAPAVVLCGVLAGPATPTAQAQFFGFSYNRPGLSIGVNQPAYVGGYYPAPVVVPQPVVVAPAPVYVAPRPYPYYGGGPYGYRGPYGHRGGYYGGYRGGYGRPY